MAACSVETSLRGEALAGVGSLILKKVICGQHAAFFDHIGENCMYIESVLMRKITGLQKRKNSYHETQFI